jgi:hypothetical protein
MVVFKTIRGSSPENALSIYDTKSHRWVSQLVSLVRWIHLKMDNFWLFLCQQIKKLPSEWWVNGKLNNDTFSWTSVFLFPFETAAYIYIYTYIDIHIYRFMYLSIYSYIDIDTDVDVCTFMYLYLYLYIHSCRFNTYSIYLHRKRKTEACFHWSANDQR